MDEMKITPPRTLVHYMNTYIARWKKRYDDVQKVIDALPEIADADKRSQTLSDIES